MPKNKEKSHYRKSGNNSINKSRSIIMKNDGISSLDIIIIVVATIVIIISSILLYTNFRTLKRVNDEINEMKVVLNEKQNTLDKLIELGNNEDMLQQNYEKNLLYLPFDKNEIGIISDVTSVIDANGGRFESISYNAEIAKENGVIDVPFTLKISSSFDELNDIIAEFSKTDRLYVIESLNIVESSSGNSILITEIKMHTYYKKQ